MARMRVFLDTNVILLAYKTGCWKTLCNHYQLETVEKCVEEALTGDNTAEGRVDVPAAELAPPKIVVHTVTRRDEAALALAHPGMPFLDDGERHLMAWMHANHIKPTDGIYLSSADRGAIRGAHELGLLDMTECLETLAKRAGVVGAPLKGIPEQHRAAWLSTCRTDIRLGKLV